ncbi:MAG: T9SS type A sorting domain-containing protein [Bacteroidales bacterium]|nr:T9SS type A sorting domain-containing protein [Bacteroidales bacterium]
MKKIYVLLLSIFVFANIVFAQDKNVDHQKIGVFALSLEIDQYSLTDYRDSQIDVYVSYRNKFSKTFISLGWQKYTLKRKSDYYGRYAIVPFQQGGVSSPEIIYFEVELDGNTIKTKEFPLTDLPSTKEGYYTEVEINDDLTLCVNAPYYYYINKFTDLSFCQNDNLPLDVECPGNQWPKVALEVAYKDPNKSIVDADYVFMDSISYSHPISYSHFADFIDNKLSKSIFSTENNGGTFLMRLKLGKFISDSVEVPPYYRQVVFSKDNISLDDNKISISNNINNYQITITNTITNNYYPREDDDKTQNKIVIEDLTYGLYSIRIEDTKDPGSKCYVEYYANIMEAKNNYLQPNKDNDKNVADFWSASHTTRNDAIILHSYRTLNESEKYQPTNLDNDIWLVPSDNYDQNEAIVCRIEDKSGAKKCDVKASETQYYIKNCHPGDNQTITISYPEGSNYLPQTIHYTLNKYFKNISAKPELIQPECADGIGTLVLTDIKGGLNNGYYYTLNRNNTIIEESTISGNSVSINVQNGDRVKIYDNKKKENELFPYTEERAWPENDKNVYWVEVEEAKRPSISTTITNPICYGSNGTLVASIEPKFDNLFYYWSISNSSDSGEGSQAYSETLPDGSYTIAWSVYKDQNKQTRCWDNDIAGQFSITQPAPITFTAKPINATCKDASNGAIEISNVIQGAEQIDDYKVGYDDEKFEESYIIQNLSPSEEPYAVKLQVNGCITEPSYVDIGFNEYRFENSTKDISCDGIANGEATINIIKSGNGSFTPNQYSWTIKQSSDNQTESTLTTVLSQLDKGNYPIELKDQYSSFCNLNTSITINETSYSFHSFTRNATCAKSSNGEASINIISTGSGTFTPTNYKWTIKDKDEPYTETTNSIINTLIPGNYTLSVESEQGCTIDTSIFIGENHYSFKTITRNTSCSEVSNGEATISIVKSGNGHFNPQIYKWTVSGKQDFNPDTLTTILSNLGNGDLAITEYPAEGCTLDTTITIDTNSYFFANVLRDVSCVGASNGEATINIVKKGNGYFTPNIYQWTVNEDTYTTVLSNLKKGKYTIEIPNQEKCFLPIEININANKFSPTLTTVPESCEGAENGEATANIVKTEGNGLFSPHYSWTIKGVTAEDKNIKKGLSCGDYHLKVEWQGKCYIDTSFSIGHKVLIPNIEVENAPCEVGKISKGVAKITITNATEPIDYKWDGEENNLSTYSLVPGTHNIVAVDKHGCTVSKDFSIFSGNFKVETKVNSALCDSQDNGSAIFDFIGGSGVYSTTWTNYPQFNTNNISTTSYTQNNLPVGIYTVTISDDKGCSYSQELNISSGDIKASESHKLASCADVANGTDTIIVSNGQGSITYHWSDGYKSSNNIRNQLRAGKYTVTVTDEANCKAMVNVNILSKTIRTEITTIGASCGLDPDGIAKAEIFAATYPYTFSWSDKTTTAEGYRQLLDKGDYSVTITDKNRCTITSDFHIPHKGYLANEVPKYITICSNGEAIVDAHEFLDYQWFYNNKTISDERFLTINRAGEYIIKARGYDDCYAVDTVDVDVSQVSFEPYFRMASVSYLDDTLVVVEQSETAPEKFEWHFDKNIFAYEQSADYAHELRLVPNTPGFYNITLSALLQNCTADITKQVEILSENRPDTLLSPLYVEKSIIEKLEISPNPTNSPFTVDIKLRQTSDVELRIYDINYGVIRSQVKLYGSETYHHQFTESLPSGMYVVILKASGEQKMAKVVVCR